MHYGESNENVPAFSLTILSGGESGQRFVFHQPEITLGRIADNDLVLYDAAVSRRHLVFYYRNHQFILEDLGSSNGTLLNGMPVTQPTVLCEEDLLDIGSVRFRFSTEQIDDFEDRDDPTEIEMSPPAAQEGALVRAKQEMGHGALPPEGDTRTFRASQIQGAGPGGAAALGMGPDQAAPQAAPVTAPPPSMAPAVVPVAPVGSQRPAQPPPQAQAAPRPPQAAPMSAAASMAQSPHPRLSAPLANKQGRQFLLMEQRRVRMASIWSSVFLVAVLVLFVIPVKPQSQTKSNAKQDEPVLLNEGIFNQVYGYNKKDQQHPNRVTFQFLYRNGRIGLSFRISSPDHPIQILLNGKPYKRIDATRHSWHYARFRLPREQLKAFHFNRITFRRMTKESKPTVWGVTQLKREEVPFPAPDAKKAQKSCDEGHALLKQKGKDPANQYKALQKFVECQGYLSLMSKLPPLYRDAALMISQIKRDLDLLFLQELQKAKSASSGVERRRLLRKLKRHFPDDRDPKHQRILQLLHDPQGKTP